MAGRRCYFWGTLAVIVAVAVGLGGYVFHANCDPRAHAAAREGDVMEWMRCEFRLTDAQHAEILRLHAEHGEVCARHCADVRAAQVRQEAARAAGDGAGAAEAEAAERAADRVCRASVEAHVRRVAAVMAPAQGERYLELVLPKVAALDHAAPPDAFLGR